MLSYTAHKQAQAGYTDVLETVRVLEKIAASQLHQLENKQAQLQTYTEATSALLHRLETLSDSPFLKSLQQRSSTSKTATPNILTIILTGDKGLVGDLWHQLYTTQTAHATRTEHLIVIGEKGRHFWSDRSKHITYHSFADRLPTHQEILELLQHIIPEYEAGKVQRVDILYPRPNTLMSHTITTTTLLPIQPPESTNKQRISAIGFPILENSISNVTELLLHKYLAHRLYQCILETALTEFSTRTIGLEHAGAKTEELISKTMRQYRKERRHADTEKQLEQFAATKT
jgi:F-type H+-transporting ATPase subunit gamma